MSSKKKLTSDAGASEESSPKKKLTADSGETAPSAPGKRLTGHEKEGEGPPPPSPPSSPAVEDPLGDNLRERIISATKQGGLRKIPENFEDTDGDWVISKSNDDPFKCLYLDYQQYRNITVEMVERHYQLIDHFWTQKIDAMNTGANRVKIISKYAGSEGNERTLRKYRDLLRQAFQRLTQPNGVEICYNQILEKRQKMILSVVDPIFQLALNDKTLEPAEEVHIKNICRAQTDLSEDEIDELIEEYIQKTGSKRGEGGGGIRESERLFFHQIKKKMQGKQLSQEDEEDLLGDIEVYNITEDRYETLVLKSLYEINGSEREKSVAQDKQNFRSFYYDLLKDFSLTENGELPEAARKKLFERDNSETDFFPLSQESRQTIVQETVRQYNKDLEHEKAAFFKNALAALDQHDGHSAVKEMLLADPQYRLLLPGMRQEQIARAISQIIETQSQQFIAAARTYFQIQHWHLDDKQIETFIGVPNQLEHSRSLRYDWLEKVRRQALFEETKNWALEQYHLEIKLMNEQVKKALQKYIHGLPLAEQDKIERDASFYLAHAERRNIIKTLEAPHRANAVKLMTESVKKALVFHTLIPEVEATLLQQGETELLLSEAKNQHSTPVQTAREIIDSLRTPFEKVMGEKVQEIAKSRRMEARLVEAFNLKYSAYISRKDVDLFIKSFNPRTADEHKTVNRFFEQFANQAQLYIVPHDNRKDFEKLLEKSMAQTSDRYKLGLKRWLTRGYENDMVKVGAAYGVDEATVKARLSAIRENYSRWTLPDWTRLAAGFLIITAAFVLLRTLIALTGYWDWIFINGPVEFFDLNTLISYLNLDRARDISQSGWWVLAAIIFILIGGMAIDD